MISHLGFRTIPNFVAAAESLTGGRTGPVMCMSVILICDSQFGYPAGLAVRQATVVTHVRTHMRCAGAGGLRKPYHLRGAGITWSES